MEKQKQREIERLLREQIKEEERRLKKEEREKKDLERQLKREEMERAKEQKREEERLKREEKKRKLEEEKKRKEDERKRRDEEKKKKDQQKDRSQMKISNFFAVKPTKSVSSTPPVEKQEAKSDSQSYEKQFLPFFQKQNVVMASNGSLPGSELADKIRGFDSGLSEPSTELKFENPEQPTTQFTTSEQLVEALNSSASNESDILLLVQHLPPIKYLQFYENAKPPYVGTWCSEKHMATRFPVANPLDTTLTGLDYNYDSDLDWDGDDDEGEDIDDLEDGEEEEEEAEDDEMEDFVEENSEAKKRPHIAPLQSVSRWNDGSDESKAYFDGIKYERLDYDISFPIDPYGEYWVVAKPPKTPKTPKKIENAKEAATISDSVSQLGATPKVDTTTPNVLTPQKPTIKDAKVVYELVKFIEKNCDFSIGTLSELSKKEFKTFTKSMLKHTIQEVAVYNKKKSVWEVKEDTKTRLAKEFDA